MELHKSYTTLGIRSPPPTFPCPYCPRYLHSNSGRRKHIKLKHSGPGLLHLELDEVEGPNPDSAPNLPPSSSSSHNNDDRLPIPIPLASDSSHNNDDRLPSPIPLASDPTSSDPPSGAEDAIDYFGDINVDDEYSEMDIPPDLNVGDESNEDLPPRDNPMEQHAPNPQIRYIYHPKLNGK